LTSSLAASFGLLLCKSGQSETGEGDADSRCRFCLAGGSIKNIRFRPALRAGHPMKLLTEYLERVELYENLAAQETDPTLKTKMQEQAKSYRTLAARRARELGLPPPSDPEISN
jgi:hypothetical protein